MKLLLSDIKRLIKAIKCQDFGFLMAIFYIIFSYLRPQAIYPSLDIVPWTQISIILGLTFSSLKHGLRLQYSHFLLLLFAFICLLSATNSYYPSLSFKYIDTPFIWFLEVLFFTNCVRTLEQVRIVTIIFFLVLFKISFFGARTWVERGFGFRDFGISGPTGFFENSGELSLLMAMLVILSISFMFNIPKIRKIYYLLPVTATMTVMAASSRGGQLALLLGYIILFMKLGKFKISSLFYLILICTILFMLIPEKQKQRFESSGEDKTSQLRLIYWKAGLEMMSDNPITGVGYYSFPSYFHDHYVYRLPEQMIKWDVREVAHNTLIQLGSTLGYPGLLSYLLLYMIIFRLNRSTQKLAHLAGDDRTLAWVSTFSLGLNISLLVFFVGSFFMSVAYYPYTFFLIMLSQSLHNAVVENDR